jgi:hypothetical protein
MLGRGLGRLIPTGPELEELWREYWHWTGRKATRKIAAGSGGAFSHATVAKLLHDKGRHGQEDVGHDPGLDERPSGLRTSAWACTR